MELYLTFFYISNYINLNKITTNFYMTMTCTLKFIDQGNGFIFNFFSEDIPAL